MILYKLDLLQECSILLLYCGKYMHFRLCCTPDTITKYCTCEEDLAYTESCDFVDNS